MVTYYTSLGRMITKEINGARVPIVIIDDSEYGMSVDELIIWGTLHWGFYDKAAVEKEYSRKKTENRIYNDVSFEQTLNRLITRGLVVSGTDYLASDALYNLIGKLKIRPVQFSIVEKLKSIVYLYFKKGLTIKECYNAYFGHKYSPDEKNVLRLSKSVGISASEMIQCVENEITDIKCEEEIMDKLYNDDNTTFDTIAVQARFSELKQDIVKAVANLYLKKKIIFEN